MLGRDMNLLQLTLNCQFERICQRWSTGSHPDYSTVKVVNLQIEMSQYIGVLTHCQCCNWDDLDIHVKSKMAPRDVIKLERQGIARQISSTAVSQKDTVLTRQFHVRSNLPVFLVRSGNTSSHIGFLHFETGNEANRTLLNHQEPTLGAEAPIYQLSSGYYNSKKIPIEAGKLGNSKVKWNVLTFRSLRFSRA